MHENNWKERDFKIDFEPFGIKGVPKKLDENKNNKTMPQVSVQVSNIYSSSDTHFFRGKTKTVHFPEVFSGKKTRNDFTAKLLTSTLFMCSFFSEMIINHFFWIARYTPQGFMTPRAMFL